MGSAGRTSRRCKHLRTLILHQWEKTGNTAGTTDRGSVCLSFHYRQHRAEKMHWSVNKYVRYSQHTHAYIWRQFSKVHILSQTNLCFGSVQILAFENCRKTPPLLECRKSGTSSFQAPHAHSCVRYFSLFRRRRQVTSLSMMNPEIFKHAGLSACTCHETQRVGMIVSYLLKSFPFKWRSQTWFCLVCRNIEFIWALWNYNE